MIYFCRVDINVGRGDGRKNALRVDLRMCWVEIPVWLMRLTPVSEAPIVGVDIPSAIIIPPKRVIEIEVQAVSFANNVIGSIQYTFQLLSIERSDIRNTLADIFTVVVISGKEKSKCAFLSKKKVCAKSETV